MGDNGKIFELGCTSDFRIGSICYGASSRSLEGKAYKIDYWARLFKARTWEELKMKAEKDDNLCEASESLYILNADDIARQKCRARQDELRWKEKATRKIDTLTAENTALAEEIKQLKQLLDANNISYDK